MVTLLLCTANRPFHLRRALTWYSEKKCSERIIIVDMSTDAHYEINKEIRRSFPRLNSDHCHFYDSLSHSAVLMQAAGYVKTPYVLVCNDYDIIIPESLKIACTFLSNNADYSAVHGNYYAFHFPEKQRRPRFYGADLYYGIFDITHESCLDRLFAISSQPSLLFNALQRRGAFIDTLKVAYDYDKSGDFYEHFVHSLTVLRGKVKQLGIPYLVRELQPSSGYIYNQHNDREKLKRYKQALIEFVMRKYEWNAAYAMTHIARVASLYEAYLATHAVAQPLLSRLVTMIIPVFVINIATFFSQRKHYAMQRRECNVPFKNKKSSNYKNVALLASIVKKSKIRTLGSKTNPITLFKIPL